MLKNALVLIQACSLRFHVSALFDTIHYTNVFLNIKLRVLLYDFLSGTHSQSFCELL